MQRALGSLSCSDNVQASFQRLTTVKQTSLGNFARPETTNTTQDFIASLTQFLSVQGACARARATRLSAKPPAPRASLQNAHLIGQGLYVIMLEHKTVSSWSWDCDCLQ